MDITYHPGAGLKVNGIRWTPGQVDQARRDARACRESRGRPSKGGSGIIMAPHCDCVCCQIDQLYRKRLTFKNLRRLELADRGMLRPDIPVPTLED